MNNVTFSEVDSTDEVCKVLNRIIDNQNQIESKLLQVIESNKKFAPKSWVSKLLNTGKKGSVTVKTLLAVILVIICFAVSAQAYVTTDINDDIASNHVLLAQYLRDSFANVTSDSFLFTPRATAPAGTFATEGRMYYDSVSNTIQLHTGSGFVPMDTAGGVSLDAAYDFGSAGGGRTITADTGAFALTNTDTDTAFLMTINAAPGSSAALGGLEITVGSNSTENAIEFENTGTGDDIQGTGDTWAVDKSGGATFVIGAFSGDVTITGSAANIEFDVSRNQLHFEDNAVLGIGGADNAAGDFTFSYDATDFNLEAAAANDDYRMGETTHFNLIIHGETNTNEVTFDTDDSALVAIWDGFDIRLNDDDLLLFGDSAEFTVQYDEDSTDNLTIVAANANDAVQIGDGTTNTDLKMMANTSGDFLIWDSSADELFFEDVDLKLNEIAQIEFAASDNATDWTIDMTVAEALKFTPTETTDDQTIQFGDATNTTDFELFGASASTVLFDASGDQVTFNAYDIALGDSDTLEFGDSTDGIIQWNTTLLKIDVVTTTAGTALQLETSDGGIHVNADGATNGDLILDAADIMTLTSVDIKIFDGATTETWEIEGTPNAFETTVIWTDPTADGNIHFPDTGDEGAAGGEIAWIADAGTATKDGTNAALPVTDALVLGTSTAASAWSLPNGEEGQILTVVIVTDGGVATITPDTANASWATAVLTDDVDQITFQYIDDTIGWMILGTSSAVGNLVQITQ